MPAKDQLRLFTTFNRPADVITYTSGDIISSAVDAAAGYAPLNPINLSAAVNPAESDLAKNRAFASFKYNGGVIKTVRVVQISNQALLPSLELWFFKSSDGGVCFDNAPIAFTDFQLIFDHLGTVPLPNKFVGLPTVGAAGNAVHEARDVNIVWPGYGPNGDGGEAATAVLNVVFVVRNAYIPVSGESFTLFADVELT